MINWRTVWIIATVVIAFSGAVTFLITWNTNQDAEASSVRVRLEAVKTGFSNHKIEANTTFREINITLHEQQKMLVEIGKATEGMRVSQNHVVEALKELKVEVKELRP